MKTQITKLLYKDANSTSHIHPSHNQLVQSICEIPVFFVLHYYIQYNKLIVV